MRSLQVRQKRQRNAVNPSLPLFRANSPVHALGAGKKPIPASTQIAHVVRPYTNARGKYVATLQQYRSHFRAQLFRRRMMGGGDGNLVGRARVAMPPTRNQRPVTGTWSQRKGRASAQVAEGLKPRADCCRVYGCAGAKYWPGYVLKA